MARAGEKRSQGITEVGAYCKYLIPGVKREKEVVLPRQRRRVLQYVSLSKRRRLRVPQGSGRVRFSPPGGMG